MYNKKDTIASLILVVITFITVSFIIYISQSGKKTVFDVGPNDRVQVEDDGGYQGMTVAKGQPHTHDARPTGSTRMLPKQDGTIQPQQQKIGEQKDDSWRKELDRLNGRLQEWFEKPGVQNSTPNNAPTQPPAQPEKGAAKDKKVVEPYKVENARNNVSFRDKMEILSIIAKVSPGDVYKVSQLINGGVTMEEGREIDSILKQHLTNEEMKALNRIIKKYITW